MSRDLPYQSGRSKPGYNEHDDRTGSGRGKQGRERRGGTWSRVRGGRVRRGGEVNPRTRFQHEDGESSMDDTERTASVGRSRFRPYSSRPFSRGATRGSVFNRLGGPSGNSFSSSVGERSGESWHKVMIQKGSTQNTEWLMKQLKGNINEPFQAIQVHKLGDKLMFFVNDARAANQLKQLGQIQSRDGPLSIFVKQCPPPKGSAHGDKYISRIESASWVGGRSGAGNIDYDDVMEDDPTEVVKVVLGRRFDTATRALDLRDMFHDPVFREQGIKASMYNKEFVSCILSLIAQYCPELQSLDLSKNGLQHLEVYSDLPKKCSNLQTLNLSENQLHSLAELQYIGGMNSLTTLILKNNPLSRHVRNEVVGFSSNLRKLFPSLQILDGQQLPSPVKFDVPVTSGQLPVVAKSYVVNDEVKQLVVTFIEQYYVMFDSDSRDKLLEAYANEAVLSVCVCSSRGPRFEEYINHDRNMNFVKDSAKRRSSLKQGRIDIVHFLRGLPRTIHHSKTFSVDVIRATPMGTAFVVYGIYSEVEGAKAVRSFTRSFVLTAAGNGVAIINDQWTIRNANQRCMQLVRGEFNQMSMVGSSTEEIPSSESIDFDTSKSEENNAQEEAILSFSQQTKMNLEWSKRCLADNDWDFNKATVVFSLMQNQGSIPSEAFQ